MNSIGSIRTGFAQHFRFMITAVAAAASEPITNDRVRTTIKKIEFYFEDSENDTNLPENKVKSF